MASLSFPKITLLFFISLFSQELKINKVEIKGWKKIKPKIIFSLPQNQEEIFELRKKIIDFYLKEGFFDVKVNIAMKKEKNFLTLFYFIEENERYQLGKINIQSKFIKPDTLEKLIKEKDYYYSQNNLNKIIKKIADFYWEIGFPFVKIDLKDFELEGKKVNFTIIIEEGEMVKIDNLSLEGEIIFNERLLKKGARFVKPFYFQKSLIEKMKKNIKRNLNLDIDNYFLILNEEKKYSLTFSFSNPRKNNFFFLFSYLPNEKILFLNLSLRIFNFLNNLEEFNLAIEKEQNKNFYFLSCQQPYLFVFKKILFSTYFKNFDTAYSVFNLDFNFYLPTKIDEFTLNFIFQKEFNNSRLLPYPSSQTFSIGQELIFNNKISNYQRGFYLSLKTLAGERKIANRSNNLKLKTEMKLEFLFFFLKENFLLHSEFFLGNIFLKDTIYDYEKFSISGKNNVRAFPENKYLSPFLLVFRNHLKYLYKNLFFPYLFIDYGYGKNKKPISLTSYGLGSEFFTKNGIFYLTFALPIKANLFDARIYFGYTYYF
ncbi:MAG: POTRA domain-containing protein [candidate division WOR-3 bacterium]